jgi:putative membrane protein
MREFIPKLMAVGVLTIWTSHAAALVPARAWAQERTYDWGWGMHPMWGMWGAWGLAMMLMMLVFWAVVIVGLVLGIRWLLSQGKFTRADSALQVLRERYARGDITKEEFDAKKRDLS